MLGLGAQHCGSFPHQKQAGETVLSLTNRVRGFGKEFEGTLSQKGSLKNRSPLNPNLSKVSPPMRILRRDGVISGITVIFSSEESGDGIFGADYRKELCALEAYIR